MTLTMTDGPYNPSQSPLFARRARAHAKAIIIPTSNFKNPGSVSSQGRHERPRPRKENEIIVHVNPRGEEAHCEIELRRQMVAMRHRVITGALFADSKRAK